MKTRLLLIIGMIGLSMFVISPVYASFADSILIHVSGDFRNLYYNEKNVTSVFFDPTSDSVIFETGSNAELVIKAPKIYKTGPNLFILENGEEIAPETTTDDCFYYVTIQTKIPEKIEIAYAVWPEYPETITQCETINVSPLKQFKSGIPNYKIQCKEGLKLLIRSSEGPSACVKGDTATELQTRWHKPNDILLGHYKDKPEVKAFYAKYDDVIISVQDDHVSYVAGNEVDSRVRMNLYFDKNHETDHITLNCYVQRQHQTDVPEEFILKYLKEYDCKKYD